MRRSGNNSNACGKDPFASLRAQLARILKEIEKLSAIMDGLATRHVAGPQNRILATHPTERKRVVVDFLNYCWCDETEMGYFGPPLSTVDLEFHQFMVWRESITNQSRREAAMEISTIAEYVACREGARKSFPQDWRMIQNGRKEELG